MQESLKNILLVMSASEIFVPGDDLWVNSWTRIDVFCPNLKQEFERIVKQEEPQDLVQNVVQAQNEVLEEPQPEVVVEESEPVPEEVASAPTLSSPTLDPEADALTSEFVTFV